MKKLALVLAVLVALLVVVPLVSAAENILLASINLGTGDGLEGIGDWGAVEPTTSSGSYGSCAVNCFSATSRVVYGPSNYGYAETDHATLTFKYRGAAFTLKVRHLDGIANDSFDVYALHRNGRWVWIGDYTDNGIGSETWQTAVFDIAAPDVPHGRTLTVKFVVKDIDPEWSGADQYGWLAIDWVEVWGNGKP